MIGSVLGCFAAVFTLILGYPALFALATYLAIGALTGVAIPLLCAYRNQRVIKDMSPAAQTSPSEH
ncbi:MAG: hypothetical protein AAFP13_09495 [Pseudomonadota bacterium]